MARRKKSEKTRFRTSTAGRKPQKYRKRKRTVSGSKGKKTKNLSGYTTVTISLCLLIGIIIWNSVRGNVHKPADDDLRVHFIDVGQGDCIYISCGGENMLIDCGEKSAYDNVIRYLNREETVSLDYVIATHPHSDHMGGMADVIDYYDNVGEVIIPPLTKDAIPLTTFFSDFLDIVEEKEIPLTQARVGMKGTLGDAEWRIISPFECDEENLNNCSVGIILKHGENSFCFTGDAEDEAEKTMVYSGVTEDVDVFKMAHHGSDTSNTELFLMATRPEIAVVSCGAGNSYGHPNDGAMARIKTYAEEIYRTDLDGNIIMKSDGKEISVTTKGDSLW